MRLPLALLVVTGCATSAPTGPDCREQPPAGTPSELTIVPAAATGPTIDPPAICGGATGWASGGFIQVHGHGTRQFAMGHEAAATACTAPPAADAAPTACPEVLVDAFGQAVLARLHDAGIDASDLGLGLCGKVSEVYADWHMSISVHAWKDADAAVRAVDQELTRWGVGGSFGVSVRGSSCVTATATAAR